MKNKVHAQILRFLSKKKYPKTGNNYFAEHPICQNNENTERFVD